MRSAGQPPADRIVRVFLACRLSPRRRRHDASARQPPQAGAPFAEARLELAILRLRVPCRAANPAVRSVRRTERGGGRNARATSRAKRVSGSFHSMILFRESLATAGSAAIIWPSQELSRFAGPTLCQIIVPRNTKSRPVCAEAVEDVTSLWKTEEI